MELVYKNLVIDIEAIQVDDYEFDMGYGSIEVPLEYFEKVANYNTNFRECLIQGLDIESEIGNYFGECIYYSNEWVGELIEYLSDEDNFEDITREDYLSEFLDNDKLVIRLNNADAIIEFMALAMELNQTKIKFTFEGNPFWICHDLNHAIHDYNGGTIVVSDDIEEARIVQGFDLLNNTLNAPHYVSTSMMNTLANAFFARFKRYLSAPNVEEYLEVDSLLYDY